MRYAYNILGAAAGVVAGVFVGPIIHEAIFYVYPPPLNKDTQE